MRKLNLFLLVILFLVGTASIVFSQSTVTLTATIRDHTPQRNPDFQYNIASAKNMVLEPLGGDETPTYCCGDGQAPPTGTPLIHNSSTFYSWFHTVDDINIAIPFNLVLTQDPNNPDLYTYTNYSFFPIDGMGFDDRVAYPNEQIYRDSNGVAHNFHFCMELHTEFAYHQGDVFSFEGDDDVWLFINKQRVVDLGGIHTIQSATISLDTLGLTENTNYDFDFFYCERHTTESDISITTSIKFVCPWYDACGICQGDNTTCCIPETCATKFEKYCFVGGCFRNTCIPMRALNCSDGLTCTTDKCVFGAGCSHVPLDCNDDNHCTDDACYEPYGCVQTTIPNCQDCDDAQCITVLPCLPSSCDPNNSSRCIITPIDCDDNNDCTIDQCLNGICYNDLNVSCTVVPPTESPTETPTESPTESPTDTPTESPTDTPTESPTDTPTESPTDTPTESPTDTPTESPTDTPTVSPTDTPLCVCPVGDICHVYPDHTECISPYATTNAMTSLTSTTGETPTGVSTATGTATATIGVTGASTSSTPCDYYTCPSGTFCTVNNGLPLCHYCDCLDCRHLGCENQGLRCKLVSSRTFSSNGRRTRDNCCEFHPTCY